MDPEPFLAALDAEIARGRETAATLGLPFCTLSYAQSLDGSLARYPMQPMVLSGEESMHMTHRLRAAHQGIMAGIRTVLADDPRLTARGVKGSDPQPVVLDSKLRISLSCRLVTENHTRPWIMTCSEDADGRGAALRERGATIRRVSPDERQRVSLRESLADLYGRGISTLMVEGGSRVLTSFLHSDLAHLAVITVSPVFVGGVPSMGRQRGGLPGLPQLEGACCTTLGNDLVLMGRLGRRDA
jgi:riboflavin-specific deaminase-like protein